MREKREREKKLPKPNCTYIMHVPYLSESKNIKCKNYNEKNKTLKSRIRDFLV
jgi:hypothetical protein